MVIVIARLAELPAVLSLNTSIIVHVHQPLFQVGKLLGAHGIESVLLHGEVGSET